MTAPIIAAPIIAAPIIAAPIRPPFTEETARAKVQAA